MRYVRVVLILAAVLILVPAVPSAVVEEHASWLASGVGAGAVTFAQTDEDHLCDLDDNDNDHIDDPDDNDNDDLVVCHDDTTEDGHRDTSSGH
jgi:hypothetical protein